MLLLAAIAWYVALAAKLIAVCRLMAAGIYKRLPFLFVYLLVSLLQQIGFSFIWLNSSAYKAWYVRTEPLMLAADYAMVVSLYWAVAEFFPRFRIAGTFVLSSVSLLASVTAYFTRALGVPPHGWEQAWELMIIFQRSAGVVLIAVLAASRLLVNFHRLFPIRECAGRAADIMLLHGIVFVWGAAALGVVADGRFGLAGFLLGLAGSAVTSGLCAIFLTRASDRVTAPAPRAAVTGELDGEIRRTLEALRDYTRILDRQH